MDCATILYRRILCVGWTEAIDDSGFWSKILPKAPRQLREMLNAATRVMTNEAVENEPQCVKAQATWLPSLWRGEGNKIVTAAALRAALRACPTISTGSAAINQVPLQVATRHPTTAPIDL